MENKILTLEQLYDFCVTNGLASFSSKETGSSIRVSIPSTYSAFKKKEEDEEIDDRYLEIELKACHTNENLNKSSISEEVMLKCMNTFRRCPILASIVEVQDEEGNTTYDFNGHDYKIIDDPFNENSKRVEYIERIVGGIPDNAELTLKADNKKDNKKYLYVKGYIFENHGNMAADIIRKRKSVACSIEIDVLELSYNAKTKIMNIEDFKFVGIALLGSTVMPGMINSKAYMSYSDKDKDGLIQIIQELNVTLDNYKFKDTQKAEEGGEGKLTFEELLLKYNKTIEEVTFEYADLTEEELTAKFEELFGEQETPESNKGESFAEDETPEEGKEDFAQEPEVPVEPTDTQLILSKATSSFNEQGDYTLSFELSHADVRSGLYRLIESMQAADNDYFYIQTVYDTHFVYESWSTEKIYGQKYSKNGDDVSLDGERYALHKELLTDSEYAELKDMRKQYSLVVEQLATYQQTEIKAEKLTVFEDASYSQFLPTVEFKELMKEESLNQYSKDELKDLADLLFAKLVKQTGSFSAVTAPESTPAPENKTKKLFMSSTSKEVKGGKQNKTPFIEGLIKKN